MELFVNHGLEGSVLPLLLGPASVKLAELGKSFRAAFSLVNIRRALFSRTPWLWVMTDEEGETFMIRANDGLCMSWQIMLPVDVVLRVPKTGSIVGICCSVNDSTICSWCQDDGQEQWRTQTGMKLMPHVFYVTLPRLLVQ